MKWPRFSGSAAHRSLDRLLCKGVSGHQARKCSLVSRGLLEVFVGAHVASLDIRSLRLSSSRTLPVSLLSLCVSLECSHALTLGLPSFFSRSTTACAERNYRKLFASPDGPAGRSGTRSAGWIVWIYLGEVEKGQSSLRMRIMQCTRSCKTELSIERVAAAHIGSGVPLARHQYTLGKESSCPPTPHLLSVCIVKTNIGHDENYNRSRCGRMPTCLRKWL